MSDSKAFVAPLDEVEKAELIFKGDELLPPRIREYLRRALIEIDYHRAKARREK